MPLPTTAMSDDADAVEALMGLGYTAGEARQALRSLGPESTTLELEERVRRALTHLAQGG